MGTSGAEIGEMNTQQAAMNWDQIHNPHPRYALHGLEEMTDALSTRPLGSRWI
ncbi:hypothetical protein DAPPUDRAFT_242600 [Daphnia pulex]|uniref:Uncharacterized protein n=1 Tax=Daphnia pulex TaxID=6669 RepID=E9GH21_DAPPU|nr:hypothetical protein DAPPUDRAFT_242600 [Daphnia pulex]|eukprot:EFX81128.1 hypothetical protein DAPPUDRAFT_242600 [Daphnia pulex]